MFKKCIYSFICFLKRCYESLDLAYKQTYSDRVFGKQINDEIKRRKALNKEDFMNKAREFARKQIKKEIGVFPPEVVVETFAKELFKQAKKCGDVDELNKFKY